MAAAPSSNWFRKYRFCCVDCIDRWIYISGSDHPFGRYFIQHVNSLVRYSAAWNASSALSPQSSMLWFHFTYFNWPVSSEFGTYRLCEQRRFRRACASAQSRQNLRCSLIQAVSQEEPSDRKPDPWSLSMAGHTQLKFVMTECSKTQIRLTRHNLCFLTKRV